MEALYTDPTRINVEQYASGITQSDVSYDLSRFAGKTTAITMGASHDLVSPSGPSQAEIIVQDSMVTAADTFSLQLITSFDRSNNPYFAYVLIPDSQLPMFKKLVTKVSLNIAEFGVIVHKGSGHVPSQAIKMRLKAEFPDAKF